MITVSITVATERSSRLQAEARAARLVAERRRHRRNRGITRLLAGGGAQPQGGPVDLAEGQRRRAHRSALLRQAQDAETVNRVWARIQAA